VVYMHSGRIAAIEVNAVRASADSLEW